MERGSARSGYWGAFIPICWKKESIWVKGNHGWNETTLRCREKGLCSCIRVRTYKCIYGGGSHGRRFGRRCQTQRISWFEWGLTSWLWRHQVLSHREENHLSGATSPEAWLIWIKEVVLGTCFLDGQRSKWGVDVFYILGKVCCKVISSEGGRR